MIVNLEFQIEEKVVKNTLKIAKLNTFEIIKKRYFNILFIKIIYKRKKMKKCKIGDKIPNFKIPLSNGNSLDSKDIKDKKYVLYFILKIIHLAVRLKLRQKILVAK